MSIHEVLATTSLQWRAVHGVRPGYDLMGGDRSLATVRAGQVELGERDLLRTEAHKRTYALVDVATGSRVASIREMPNSRAVLNAGSGRYRMTKQGVLPIRLEVTHELGGPQVLQMLRLGPIFRVRAGRDMDTVPGAAVDLLVVLAGMRVLDLLTPSKTVASLA